MVVDVAEWGLSAARLTYLVPSLIHVIQGEPGVSLIQDAHELTRSHLRSGRRHLGQEQGKLGANSTSLV